VGLFYVGVSKDFASLPTRTIIFTKKPALHRAEILYLDERARVAEILGVFGDCVAIQTGVTGVLHQGPELILLSLFPQLAEMAPMPFRVFTVGFYGFRHNTSGYFGLLIELIITFFRLPCRHKYAAETV
jgi:hypothetical protein